MTAREEMLARIAACAVPRTEHTRLTFLLSQRDRHAVVEQFAELAADYKATVHRCASDSLAPELERLLPGRTVAPPDLPVEWFARAEADRGFTPRELATYDSVLTGCALGIAETGTLVLDAGFAQGRRLLSLVPDHHVCVIFEPQIVDTLPEAVARLDGTRPLTWISGPSATSDIELSRVEGVHGPRRLDIVLVA